MKKILFLIFIYLFITSISYGQKLSKNQLYGTWVRSTGEPGRTIQKNDSSTVSLLPVTYSITTLKLKKFGRAVETTQGFHGNVLDSKFKGKWKLNGDTLNLQFGNKVEIYFIDQSIQYRIFLNSLNSSQLIYRRKE